MKFLKRLTLVVALVGVLSTSAFAKETQNLSTWAIKTVNDAQMQGIYPMTKESLLRDFTKTVSLEDLNSLNKLTEEKLKSYALKTKSFTKEPEKKDFTREDVIINIYNSVGKYSADSGSGAVEYFKKNKLINGDGTDLKLNEKASLEQAITLYSRAVSDVINDQNMGSKGVFYKTSANGNTVYMFGSIHIGNSSMYPIDSDVMDAFEKSDILYVEADITDSQKVIDSRSKLISDIPLKEKLGDELYSKYKSVMDKYRVPEEEYKNSKLFSAYSSLSSISSLPQIQEQSARGIDAYFLINQKLSQKPVGEVESIDFQFDMMDSFGDEKYISLIRETLLQIENGNANDATEDANRMQKIWRDGNESEFKKIFANTDDYTSHLFVTRDPAMANKIDEMLKSPEKKTYFVVVGSGHYAPDNSVLKYLKDKGYEIENLTGM